MSDTLKLTGKRPADWAERALASWWDTVFENALRFPLLKGSRSWALLHLLRRAEKRGYQRGKTDGYKEGHEDQLEMRRIERRECERT